MLARAKTAESVTIRHENDSVLSCRYFRLQKVLCLFILFQLTGAKLSGSFRLNLVLRIRSSCGVSPSAEARQVSQQLAAVRLMRSGWADGITLITLHLDRCPFIYEAPEEQVTAP